MGSHCCTHCQCALEYPSTMGTSVIGGNFLRIKLDSVWVRLLSPKLDIILKLIGINGSDLFMKGSC